MLRNVLCSCFYRERGKKTRRKVLEGDNQQQTKPQISALSLIIFLFFLMKTRLVLKFVAGEGYCNCMKEIKIKLEFKLYISATRMRSVFHVIRLYDKQPYHQNEIT